MYVFVRTSDGTQSQMIIDLAGKLYIRSRSSSAWRSWVTYITKSDLTSAVSTALQEAKDSGAFQGDTGPQGLQGEKGDPGADGKSAYAYAQDGGYQGTEEDFAEKLAADYIDWFGDGTSIPSGADLNTYMTPGKYYLGSSGVADEILNCPVANDNFVLYVFRRTTGKSINQMIITLNGALYIRGCNSSGSFENREWHAKPDDTYVDKAIQSAIDSGVLTPVRGVDYWTQADQESIVQQVIDALGTPVFGTVDENNIITLSGDLTDGSYTVKYENADGSLTTIGTLTPASGAVNYTNQLPIATDADGSVYNGTGYKYGVRWSNSSAAEVDYDNSYLSGYIPVSAGDTVRLKNIEMLADTDGNLSAIFFFSDYGTNAGYVNCHTNIDTVSPVWEDGSLVQFTAIYSGYFRITASYMGADSIITVNETIS